MIHTKFVALDIETTGLDSTFNEIIEIGGVLFSYDKKKKEYKIEKTFEFKIKPEHIENANKIALKVNGYKPHLWVDALNAHAVLKKVAKLVKGRVMVAHNAPFDFNFLNESFKKYKIKNTLHYHVLDTISIGFLFLKNTDATRLSLAYLCDYFNIENKKAHTALSDAMATYELFVKLMSI